MVRYSFVLGVEEPHQFISNLMVKFYYNDEIVGKDTQKNSYNRTQ